MFEENFTGSAYLATPSQAVLDASWEFFMKFEFNPSSANYTDVYVMADRANLSENLNGYFLRVGSTKDDICLYKKTGATSTKIIEGIEKRLDSDPVNLRIKLTRDYEGNWSLFSDTLGGFNYILEGTVLDNTHTESAFFGVYCKYSTTRKDKIFFDDFVVTGDFIVDEEAPVLESATAISENTLLLSFNEALSSNVLSATNFTVNQSLGNPAFVEFADASQAALELKFSSNFVSAQEYQLEYKNIEDLSGNITPTSSVSFMYIDIVPNIIVINEIMADPNPPVGLPEAEYIELFNTSAASIDLSDWKLVVGNYVRPIPSVSIEGNGYLVLCNPNNVDLFEVSIPILGVPSFPAIPNNGSTLKLLTDEDVEINSVSYDLSWYGDSQKANGGWALELIDPFNQCSAYGNWTASNNPNGGTPGYINSVFAENPDTIPPELVSVQVVDANQIIVNFNEFVDTISALNTANYHISPEFGNPDIALLQEDRKSVSLFMPWAFTQDELYTLKVSNLEDMCGNVAENQEISFSLHLPEMYDLLITEIMADPDPPVALPNAEYVEIYNRSDFPFDLSDWKLQVNKSSCSLNGITIQPNEYITICNINNLHLFQDIEKVYGVASFPALPNAGATISLISPEQEYIHALAYSDTWYRSNFKKSGGWSLEMIDTNNPCEGANNWKASENQNGGTPSKLNSVKAENPDFTRPDIIHAEIVNADTVRVFFNETMRISSLEPSQNYWLDWNIGSPSWAYPEPPLYQSVLLKFDANFEKGKVYTLNFSDTIADCAGNKVMLNYETIIGISDSIQPGDIVINEILFNPFT
ncbi:MAG: hypothetical protein GX879_03525, partial [Bacteroidales bacterium]|nr:hypothetical protein [Bacteroidales bacterium]